MKNKRIIGGLIFLLINLSLYAEKISVAKIIVFDENSSKVESNKKMEKELIRKLNSYWFEGLISFELLNSSYYGDVYTVIDANKACDISDSLYLLYGFIQKNEKSWFANLKLYSRNEKKIVKEFFGSDDIDKYDRLLEDLSLKIIDGINEITGLDIKQKMEDETSNYKLYIPASLYYWNSIMGKWNNVLTGIAGVNAGIEFYPEQPVHVYDGKKYDWSFGLNINYAFGIGKNNSYPLNYHAVGLYSPILLHVYFNNKHTAYFGTGLFYEFEFMNVIKKYEDESFYYQNIFGLELIAGYEYIVNQKINLKTDVKVDFHVNDNSFISIKPSLGLNIKL